MKKIKLLLLAIAMTTNLSSHDYSFEFFNGFVYNFKEDLTIMQEGQANIIMNDVEFKTKPLETPYYYGMRISRWFSDDTAWELEHVHQKLYIDDLPTDVQKFEITDGFNFFMLNKAWKDKKINLVYRLGTGIVVSHPDITVRNKTNFVRGGGAITMGEGYHLTGFVWQASVQKIFNFTERFYLGIETKVTYAHTNVPIADGNVDVENKALHLNFAAGYKF